MIACLMTRHSSVQSASLHVAAKPIQRNQFSNSDERLKIEAVETLGFCLCPVVSTAALSPSEGGSCVLFGSVFEAVK